MPNYQYQAVDNEGKTITDKLTANSLAHARQQLQDRSLIVFELIEEDGDAKLRLPKLKSSQKMLWIRQLATLLGAGYTLENALKASGKQSQDESLKHFSESVHQSVSEGLPFHKVLAKYSKLFNASFCATIEAGESSGCLDVVLERLAEHEETASGMRSDMLQALIYPIILVIVSSLLITYLMVAVIPDVVKVFSSSGQTLPIITQWLLMIAQALSRYGVVFVLIVFVLIWMGKRWLRDTQNRQTYHAFMLRIPLVGNILRNYYTANFSATLAMLLDAGVKLVDALQITTQTLSNSYLQKTAIIATEEVKKGKSLAFSLGVNAFAFPSMFLELIDGGERTGGLVKMLYKAADIYQRQSQAKLKALNGLLGPFMILIMGGLIFMIVLAILLPIFDLNQAIR